MSRSLRGKGSALLWRSCGEIAGDLGHGVVEFSQEMDKIGSLVAFDLGRRATGGVKRGVASLEGYLEKKTREALDEYGH